MGFIQKGIPTKHFKFWGAKDFQIALEGKDVVEEGLIRDKMD